MLTVKFIRDANIPGVGNVSKNTKIKLSLAQAQFAVNRGYAVYLDPLTMAPIAETVQMIDSPVPLKEEPPETLLLNKDTQKSAPPLEPVGEPEDGSRKRKKSKEG